MKRAFVLICYNLGLWGILGFFATLLLGFLSCCANLPQYIFYTSLIAFAGIGITVSAICVTKGCKKVQ